MRQHRVPFAVGLIVALLFISFSLPAASAQSVQDVVNAARKDPEVGDHFGMFVQPRITIGTYGGRITLAATIVSSFSSHRVNPLDVNAIAQKNHLYRPNIYGVRMLLRDSDFSTLVSLASQGELTLTHETRVVGRIPVAELHNAETSPKQYIIIAVFDHSPVLVTGMNWATDGSLTSIRVSNPIGPEPDLLIPLKAGQSFDPSLIDRWDFFVLEKGKQ